MTPAFAAVLFDMDGVIIDNTPLHRRVWGEFARQHGLDPSDAEIRRADGRRAVDVVRMLFGAEPSDEEVGRLAAAREVLYRQELRTAPVSAVPGVRDFLASLGAAGLPRVLATSATHDNVAVVLSRLELGAMFDAVVSAEHVRHGKPHPEVYLEAARRAKAPAEACLVVEDALPGIQSAKAAGAWCLGLSTSQSQEALQAAGADWVAPHFMALPASLQERF